MADAGRDLDSAPGPVAGSGPDAAPVPTELRLAPDGAALRLVWASGAIDSFAAAELRAACQCAECVRQRHDDRFPGTFPDVTIDTLDLIGAQAVNIRFSDGHGRGIYPWSYLRSLASK